MVPNVVISSGKSVHSEPGFDRASPCSDVSYYVFGPSLRLPLGYHGADIRPRNAPILSQCVRQSYPRKAEDGGIAAGE